MVRLPSRFLAQVDLICEAVVSALEMCPDISPYIQFIRYDHDKAVTDELSARRDIRVIWGGGLPPFFVSAFV